MKFTDWIEADFLCILACGDSKKSLLNTKKRTQRPAFCKFRSDRILALGELERTTSLGATVLLTFNDAAIAGQESTLLKNRAQAWFVIGERLGDTMTYGTSLTGTAAASNSSDNVKLSGAV